MADKSRERAILNMIYDDRELDEIICSESPDFRIWKRGQTLPFGVEVTEFYYSESNARIRNIPYYITEVLSGGSYRHKDDKSSLPVEEMKLVREGEPDRKIKGIFQKLPVPSEYARMIARVVCRKNDMLKGYTDGLSHVNLILFDTENRLFEIAVQDFYKYFFTADIMRALRKSDFQEIYFITKLEKDRSVYIPLKLVLLLSELYLFNHLLVTYYRSLCKGITAELSLFAQYLRRKGMGQVYIRQTESEYEVLWSGYGVTVKSSRKPIIRDYADYKIPDDTQLVRIEHLEPFTDGTFNQRMKDVLENHTFACGLALNVRDDNITS